MVEVKQRMITLYIEPEDVFESFPSDFLGLDGKPEQGFSGKMLSVPLSNSREIVFEVSYDGESELIAQIKEAPIGISIETAKESLLTFLDIDDDSEEEEDEGDDEDDKQPA